MGQDLLDDFGLLDERDNPHRVAKTFSAFGAAAGLGSSTNSQTPRVSASWDRKFAVWTSLRVGLLADKAVFIVMLDRTIPALVTPNALVQPYAYPS